MDDWRAQWEKSAKAESRGYAKKPLEDLFDIVAKGRYGRYYSLWGIIARRATLEEAGWMLVRVLRTEKDYLNRYHCASALLTLMGKSPVDAVKYSSEAANFRSNLDDLEQELMARIGPDNT